MAIAAALLAGACSDDAADVPSPTTASAPQSSTTHSAPPTVASAPSSELAAEDANVRIVLRQMAEPTTPDEVINELDAIPGVLARREERGPDDPRARVIARVDDTFDRDALSDVTFEFGVESTWILAGCPPEASWGSLYAMPSAGIDDLELTTTDVFPLDSTTQQWTGDGIVDITVGTDSRRGLPVVIDDRGSCRAEVTLTAGRTFAVAAAGDWSVQLSATGRSPSRVIEMLGSMAVVEPAAFGWLSPDLAGERLTIGGLGLLRIGESLDALVGAGFRHTKAECDDGFRTEPFGFVSTRTTDTLNGIYVFAEDDERFDEIVTLSGIGIGDTREEVLAVYGDHLEERMVEYEDYDPGEVSLEHRLEFVPADEADADLRMIFRLEDGLVYQIRAGYEWAIQEPYFCA